MIPVIFIDQLLINAADHEKIMDVFLSYCKFIQNLEIQNGMNK